MYLEFVVLGRISVRAEEFKAELWVCRSVGRPASPFVFTGVVCGGYLALINGSTPVFPGCLRICVAGHVEFAGGG